MKDPAADWARFVQSGSIFDYLNYKAGQLTQELNIDTESLAVGLIAPKKEAVPIAFLPIENSENSSDKALARLIKYYGMLNSVGRGKAVERMEELAQIPPYTEE